MTNEELQSYEYKVRTAKQLKTTINAIDEIIRNIKEKKCKCEKINFQGSLVFDGEFDFSSANVDITAKELGMAEKDFQDFFDSHIIKHLVVLKTLKQKEFDDLK